MVFSFQPITWVQLNSHGPGLTIFLIKKKRALEQQQPTVLQFTSVFCPHPIF